MYNLCVINCNRIFINCDRSKTSIIFINYINYIYCLYIEYKFELQLITEFLQ